MKRFEIMYSNGKIYSGENLSDWNACPPTGVNNVTVLHDDGAQERIIEWDYYILDDDNEVIGTNVLVPGSVKEGELVTFAQHVLMRDSVFSGSTPIATYERTGTKEKVNIPIGVSRIWNCTEETPWEVGVRDAVNVNTGEQE